MCWLLTPVLLMAVAVLGGCCQVSSHKQDAASVPNESELAELRHLVPPPVPRPPDDQLYPGDAVVLIVERDPPSVPSCTEFMAVVQEDFTVTLLSNQVFTTTGKTYEEFTREVHDYYVPRLFKNVSLMRTDPPVYIVRGEVWSPGLRVLYRPTTVLGAAELAGGFTSSANKKRVEVRRFNRTSSPYMSYTTTHVVDCEKAQRDRAADMEVQRDDVIMVPRSLWKHWFHPGRERLTNGSSQ